VPKCQIPPDLVVNSNLLILLTLFYGLSCDRVSCINGESRAELSSPYEGSCPPLKPMECRKSSGLLSKEQEG
jgi:hypothetical protein